MNVHNDKEFDDFLRSTLLGGSEDAPEGMWEKISGKLEGEEAARPRSRGRYFWIPALAALAVAAALLFDPRRPAGVEPAEEVLTEQVVAETSVQSAVEYPQPYEAKASAPVSASPYACVARESQNTETLSLSQTEETTGEEKTAVLPSAPVKVEGQSAPDVPEKMEIAESAEWTEPAEDAPSWRRRIANVQLVAIASTGGNLGRHKYSVGKSSTSAVDFGGGCKITETECTFTAIPICLGVGLKMNINESWAIGTGLTYTYIGRRFSGTYDDGAIEKYNCESITNNQHYLGIPLNLYFTFARSGRLSFYAFAGGTVEKCLTNSYSFDYEGSHMDLGNSVKGMQLSVSAGAGLQFQLARLISLYIDPEFKYYFKNSLQPKSIRTTQPFQLGCEAGLRFNL